MSRLLPPFPANIPRAPSTASMAASETTFHSFCDVELFKPTSPPREAALVDPPLISREMRRQDSGYESLPPRTSSSRRRSSAASTSPKPKRRPSIRRASKTAPIVSHASRASGQSPYLRRAPPQLPSTFFHFPSLESNELADLGPHSTEPESPYQLPPQTTHYWTSDRTRRLEYAAIDAASRGVKGWVRRHLVPDCFIPRENRRIGFDDDTGSVRRYRLDLEDGEETPGLEKVSRESERRSWLRGLKNTA